MLSRQYTNSWKLELVSIKWLVTYQFFVFKINRWHLDRNTGLCALQGVASIGTFLLFFTMAKTLLMLPDWSKRKDRLNLCLWKRLGLEDSIMQNWSLYWPTLSTTLSLCKSFIQEHILCLVWGCWLRVDLVLLPWWSLYYWDSYIYNLKLVYNQNVTQFSSRMEGTYTSSV